jgi:DNA-3-methyladenine glycosylase II
MPNLMQEHPGWTPTPTGYARVMRSGVTTRHLTWHAASGDVDLAPAAAAELSDPPPVVDVVGPEAVADLFGPLGSALATSGPVARVRNCDLWDAIGTAINRQVVTAVQARTTHQRFCTAYGEQVLTPAGVLFLFPSATRVAELADEDFDGLGMKFKRPILRAAAEAYLANASTWVELPPAELATALRGVFRIGPWTAGAAVADWSNDFTQYPYYDMAVRHWARTAAPGLDWPTTDATFGPLWRTGAGDHLSALTLLTLAQGGARVNSEP